MMRWMYSDLQPPALCNTCKTKPIVAKPTVALGFAIVTTHCAARWLLGRPSLSQAAVRRHRRRLRRRSRQAREEVLQSQSGGHQTAMQGDRRSQVECCQDLPLFSTVLSLLWHVDPCLPASPPRP